MGFLLKLFGGGAIKGILGGVDKILGRFRKNRDKVETNIHSEQMAALNAGAAEFHTRANRTWFDSLIDGINRLPRPTFAFLVIGVLVYAPVDPAHFIVIMKAYTLVPEWLAVLLGVIAAFYFGSRHLENRLEMKGPTPGQIKTAAELARELAAREVARTDAPAGPPAGAASKTAVPGSLASGRGSGNAAIEAWKKTAAGS